LTYYKDQSAQQKAQWKIHKRLCAKLTTEQKRKIDDMSLDTSLMYFQKLVSFDGKHNDTVYLMKHIRKLYDDGVPDPNDVELEFHTICRTLIFYPDDSLVYAFYTRPGMANYLLMDDKEDLLNH
jgi:hypothetical protein